IGEVRGLKELNTLQRKKEYEAAYTANARAEGQEEYAKALVSLEGLYGQYVPYATARDMLAERMDHHPTWTNTFGLVEICLRTHDAGGRITDRDRSLATAIDALLI
ncbi:MAG: 4a-hydroxytetrahydrobiopterin dehydratase, partial [Flavobacteriales bacterium]